MSEFAPPALIGVVFRWLEQLVHPVKFTSKSLQGGWAKRALPFLARYWTFPIFLAVAADGIVLHAYQIEFSQYYFTIPYLVFAVLSNFIQALVFYVLLRAFGLRCELGVVFVTFTVFVAYAPIYSWMGLPGTYHHFVLAAKIKATHPDFLLWGWKEFGEYISSHHKELLSLPDGYSISVWGDGAHALLSFCLTALVGEMLAQIYRFDRFKVLLAASIGNIFSVFPQILGGFAQLALFYAYAP